MNEAIPVVEHSINTPVKAAPMKLPPMKIEDDEPAPVIDPANETAPEKLPEADTLPRGTHNPPKARGTNVKNWFTTAPLGSR